MLLAAPPVFAENVTTTDEMYLKVRAVGEKLKQVHVNNQVWLQLEKTN